MRDFKGMKRQRGRNRGGSGPTSGGGKPQQNANRAFDSNGPENMKVRGHAQHVFEKYQQLARDATSSGDRVLAENFLQHAEHYFRLLRTLQPNRPISDFIARDNFASGYDIDFEDESGAQALPEEQPGEGSSDGGDGNQTQGGDQQQQRGDYQQRDNCDGGQYRDRDQNRDGQQRDRYENRQGRDRNRFDRDRPRDDRPRDDRPRDDRGYRADGQEGEPRQEARDDRGYRDRDDRPYRDERPRDDRPRGDRPRDDRPREDRGYREDRPRRDRFENRERGYRDDRGERAADPMAVIEPLVAAAPVEDHGRMLRSRDGEMSHAPAFLQAAAPSPSAGEDGEAAAVKRPRGRPRKPKADETTGED